MIYSKWLNLWLHDSVLVTIESKLLVYANVGQSKLNRKLKIMEFWKIKQNTRTNEMKWWRIECKWKENKSIKLWTNIEQPYERISIFRFFSHFLVNKYDLCFSFKFQIGQNTERFYINSDGSNCRSQQPAHHCQLKWKTVKKHTFYWFHWIRLFSNSDQVQYV